MHLPESWTQVSAYCLRNGNYTIAKIGSKRGWSYELWNGKQQLIVNLSRSADALKAYANIASTGKNAA